MTIIIKVDEADYKERYEKELKKISKTANIKGFRPGFVPKQIIEKMYGKEILAKEVSDLIDETLNKIIKEDNISLVGEILPSEAEKTEFDILTSKNYKFAFDIAYHKPLEIDLSKIEAPYYNIKVEDEKIKQELEKYRKNYGQYIEIEEATEESTIVVDLKEIKEAEEKISAEKQMILLNKVKEEQRKQLMSIKKGETIKVKIKEVFDNETDLAYTLAIDKSKISEISEEFELTLVKIQKYQEAEMNQEFFDKVFGKDKVKSEEEAIEEMRKIYKENFEKQSKERFMIDLKNTLMSQIEVPLPETFIIRWQKEVQKKTEDQIKKDLPFILEIIKWNRISTVLAKQMDIKIEYNDILGVQKTNIERMLFQYGINSSMLTDEMLTNYAAQDIEKMKDNDKRSLYYEAFENKILEAGIEKAKKNEKEITFEEFEAIYKSEYEAQKEKAEKLNQTEKVDA